MDWKQVQQDILALTDIESVYVGWGAKWASEARVSGWRPCHAIGRDDNSPSAEVYVGTGPSRGRYRDFGDGSGQSVGLFDFAVDYARQFSDWRDARKYFADKAGVDITTATTGDKIPRDGFRFYDFHEPSLVDLFAKFRPGISTDAVVRSGSLSGCWNRQEVYAWPCFGEELFMADPTGYHCLGDAGRQITIKSDDDKHKTMQKGRPGLLNTWTIKHLEQAEIIWWVEGITDMLAMQTLLRDSETHLVTTMGGISYHPSDEMVQLFAGKTIYIVFDSDPPTHKFPAGQGAVGSVQMMRKLIGVAKEIRNIKLPQPDLTKKVDVRDYILSGQKTYEDMLTLANGFAPVDTFGVNKEIEKLNRKGTITNYVSVPVEGGNVTVEPISAGDIIQSMKASAGDWPRTVSGELFYIRDNPVSGNKEVKFLQNQSALFGYFHKAGLVDWQSNHSQCMTKAEYYQVCLTETSRVESVETHPHYPPIEGAYYLNPSPAPTSELTHITKFVNFFNPSTEEDWNILFSCVCTMYWGGPNGSRPAFLFTSRDGRGVGKTTTAQLISALVGGPFRFSKAESIETINKRLLTSDAMTKRVCLVDNIKTNRFSWVDFESLVTSDFISGHKMYKGNAQRANLLTWFLTLNGPSLSTDISQRCIICELKKPREYGDQWLETVQEYVRDNHMLIAADVRSIFEREPAEFQVKLRWGTWAKQVLGRLYNAEKVQNVIVGRQKVYDVEAEENNEIEAEIRDKLSMLSYRPDDQIIFIPSRVMHRLYNEITLTRNTPVAVTRAIKQAVGEGQLKRLEPNQIDPRRKIRGTLWKGVNTTKATEIEYDLEERANATQDWKKYL